MARPEDIARAEAFIKAHPKDPPVENYTEPLKESIYVTKGRELQRSRRNALLGIRAGDLEPLGRYRDDLLMFAAYVGLTRKYDLQHQAIHAMHREVGADRTNEQIAEALEEHEDAIRHIVRGILG